MEDSHILRDILYGQLTSDNRSVGCPLLRFTDVHKRDLKGLDTDINRWENISGDHSS